MVSKHCSDLIIGKFKPYSFSFCEEMCYSYMISLEKNNIHLAFYFFNLTCVPNKVIDLIHSR